MLVGVGGYDGAGKDAFADAICRGFGWRKTYMSSKLVEAFGCEIVEPESWMQVVFGQVDAWLQEGRSVVVVGLRFRDELEELKRRGGVSVWVSRDNARLPRVAVEEFDHQVVNDGSLDHLAVLAAEVVAYVGATVRSGSA